MPVTHTAHFRWFAWALNPREDRYIPSHLHDPFYPLISSPAEASLTTRTVVTSRLSWVSLGAVRSLPFGQWRAPLLVSVCLLSLAFSLPLFLYLALPSLSLMLSPHSLIFCLSIWGICMCPLPHSRTATCVSRRATPLEASPCLDVAFFGVSCT